MVPGACDIAIVSGRHKPVQYTRPVVIMSAGVQPAFIHHLECPVCLNNYRDPRLLPCPQGSHTVCKACLDHLVKETTIVCPVCGTTHAVPATGPSDLPRDLSAAGMGDSLCKECKLTPPAVRCCHCDIDLCQICHDAHHTFHGVQRSFHELRDQLEKAGKDGGTAEVQRIGADVEREIDNALDLMARQLEERRQTLKKGLQRMINKILDDLKICRQELERNTVKTRKYLETADSRLGDKYDYHITQKQMERIKRETEAKTSETETYLRNIHSFPRPMFKYNSQRASSAILSFGSMQLLPVDVHVYDCPVAIDTDPITQVRPREVGKRGTGPGEVTMMHCQM